MFKVLTPATLAAAGPSPAVFILDKHVLKRIVLRISYTLGAGGTIYEDGVSRLLQQIRIYNGSTPVFALSGRMLRHILASFGSAEAYTEATASGTGTWDFVIPFSDPMNPEYADKTGLDLRQMENPRMEIDFGSAADVGSGLTFSAGSAAACADYITLSAAADRVRRTIDRSFVGYKFYNLPTSATRHTLALSPRELIRRIYILVTANATPWARINTGITNLQWKVNGVPIGTHSFMDLRAMTRQVMPVAPPTGFALYNFDPEERCDPSRMLDLRGAQTFELEVDTDATARDVEIGFEQIILPPAPSGEVIRRSRDVR